MSIVLAKSRSPARRQEVRRAGARRACKSPESAAPGASMREEATTKRGHLDVAGTPSCAQVLRERFAVERLSGKPPREKIPGGASLWVVAKTTPTSSMPPSATPDEDLAALCRERMRKNPGFTALVGLMIPSADASAPDGTLEKAERRATGALYGVAEDTTEQSGNKDHNELKGGSSPVVGLPEPRRLFSKNRTTGSGAVTWPFYWRIHQFLGSLPVNDATLAVESNCESLSVSQIVRSMETGNELSELELLGSEAEMQLVIEVPESSSATVATSTANLEQTATGPAETAGPAVESLPQCSESSPAEAGATVAQPAASKKGHELAPILQSWKWLKSKRC
ncbi:hypothetical protein MRX96_056783 [Rhipicephalus microplus]